MKIEFKNLELPKLHEKGKERRLNISLSQSCILVLPPSEGKTYLFEHIIGLRKKFEGEIFIDSVKVDLELDSGFFEFRKKMGILFEKPVFLSNLSLSENLKLILVNSCQEYNEQEVQSLIQKALKKFNLVDCEHRRPSELTQNQQKLGAFIMGIIHDPHLLVWDEPNMNFPSESKALILDEIQKLRERNAILLGLSSTEAFSLETQLPSMMI